MSLSHGRSHSSGPVTGATAVPGLSWHAAEGCSVSHIFTASGKGAPENAGCVFSAGQGAFQHVGVPDGRATRGAPGHSMCMRGDGKGQEPTVLQFETREGIVIYGGVGKATF